MNLKKSPYSLRGESPIWWSIINVPFHHGISASQVQLTSEWFSFWEESNPPRCPCHLQGGKEWVVTNVTPKRSLLCIPLKSCLGQQEELMEGPKSSDPSTASIMPFLPTCQCIAFPFFSFSPLLRVALLDLHSTLPVVWIFIAYQTKCSVIPNASWKHYLRRCFQNHS